MRMSQQPERKPELKQEHVSCLKLHFELIKRTTDLHKIKTLSAKPRMLVKGNSTLEQAAISLDKRRSKRQGSSRIYSTNSKNGSHGNSGNRVAAAAMLATTIMITTIPTPAKEDTRNEER